LGIYAELPKVRSVVTLHSLSKTNQTISAWLTVNMEAPCVSETWFIYQAVDAV